MVHRRVHDEIDWAKAHLQLLVVLMLLQLMGPLGSHQTLCDDLAERDRCPHCQGVQGWGWPCLIQEGCHM